MAKAVATRVIRPVALCNEGYTQLKRETTSPEMRAVRSGRLADAGEPTGTPVISHERQFDGGSTARCLRRAQVEPLEAGVRTF
jgi:hypothetical protein